MADNEQTESGNVSQSDFVANALKRFKEMEDDERDIRDLALRDLKFVIGDQWDPKIKSDRERAGRPALTFNRLPVFVQRIANEARQQKPQIKFNPRDEELKQTAEVFEGLARQIQYDSDAEIAFETAIDYSASCSFGYFRILSQYVDDDTFDQELKIVPVVDPFQVYGVMIPTIFGRKVMDAFVVEDIPIEEYKRMYPKSSLAGNDFPSDGKNDWIGTETYRVAEYWNVESKTETLYLLEDGTTTTEKPAKFKSSREVCRDVVKSRKINGIEVLEDTETEWVTRDIPIIPVLGASKIVDSKPRVASLVRDMLDPQVMINYSKTRIAETLATAPISPFVGVEGQFEGHEAEWQSINSTLSPYVQYKPVSLNGSPVPPPQRQTFEPPIQALSAFVAQEVEDLKATSGIFDQSLGMGTNDQSGLAIQRRQQQSDLTNFHYLDNLERGFKKAGRIIAEAIPKIYDGARVVQILGNDESATAVQINKEFADESGQTQHHDIAGGAGKYDILVTSGKAFSSKRMESFDMVQSLVQSAPNMLPMFGDILFANSDIAGADVLSERFKKMLPPNLQDQKDQQNAQQQLQQLSAQHQQLVQALNQAHQIIETKQVEQQAKVQMTQMQEQSRQAIEKMKIEADILKAEITTKAQILRDREQMTNEVWSEIHGASHDLALQQHAQQHQAEMAQQQAQNQAALSAQNADQSMMQQQAAQQAQQGQQ